MVIINSWIFWTYNIFFLIGSNDAGFSCAWNQSSEKFAVASQDGFVSVWDIRNTGSKIAKLGSKQNPQVKGACRSVKFSPTGSIDLLLYSEVYFLLYLFSILNLIVACFIY